MADIVRTSRYGALTLVDGVPTSLTVSFMDGGIQAQLLNAARAPLMVRGVATQWFLLEDSVYDVSFSLHMMEILGYTTGNTLAGLTVVEALRATAGVSNNNTYTFSSTSAAGHPRTLDLKWTVTNPEGSNPATEVITFPKFYAEVITVDESTPNKISVTGKCLTIPTVAIT